MASFAQEKEMKAHLLLIAEAGTYAGYFSQGTNADGDVSTFYLTTDSDKAAADTLLDAKVAELTANDIGGETAGGEGPSEFDGFTPIHYDDDVAGSDYRTWFVKDADGEYYKTDNGNSDNLAQISDADEITTLITDSGYIA